jgi:polysaccharide export outer membrane protein
MRKGFRRAFPLAIATLLLLLTAGAVFAEDYVLGPEDVIIVSVWLHPELERTITIGSDGNIVYPPIGSVQAGGLTPKQLGDRLADRLGTFLRQTTQVTVTVNQFMSRSVFVAGAVAKPGRYGFEHLPSIVDVISQAGGALAGADLGHVQIIRREGETRRTIDVDVASALRDGVGTALPELKPGDTIMVQGQVTPGAAPPGEGVGVIGNVVHPGLFPVTGSQDLWSVLAAAGGATTAGDLGAVSIITRAGASQAVATINLRDVLKHGSRAPFLVRSGDVIYVPPTSERAGGRAFAIYNATLGVARDLLSLVLLKQVVNP